MVLGILNGIFFNFRLLLGKLGLMFCREWLNLLEKLIVLYNCIVVVLKDDVKVLLIVK